MSGMQRQCNIISPGIGRERTVIQERFIGSETRVIRIHLKFMDSRRTSLGHEINAAAMRENNVSRLVRAGSPKEYGTDLMITLKI